MGHLHQTNKNIRSTQPTLDKTRYKECEPSTHESLHISKIWKTQLIFAVLEKMVRVYTDQTGQLPITSSKVNNYLCLLYEYCEKTIITDPLKN